MLIGEALKLLDNGSKVTRLFWKENLIVKSPKFLYLVNGSTFKVNRKPLLGIFKHDTEIHYSEHVDAIYVSEDGSLRARYYDFTQEDLLAADWIEYQNDHDDKQLAAFFA
jgi:hypothetical protein